MPRSHASCHLSVVREFTLRPCVRQGVKFWLRSSEDSILLRFYVGTLVFSSILQTALETYKVWLDVIIRKHWVYGLLRIDRPSD
ncbi:hypothetical protein SCP_0211320 [Sparassis crispa]|uniref:Uncharacterized protein n=1 Tax=Sparassis crispa TaxID=139825 RepID=A0A401GCP3_9APHY|nr:hypothetical protein SCP_0211320 [Sparassis crispa]GBE79930.1 hypothetical protein SCP_0211320 [Sparassis crispa]